MADSVDLMDFVMGGGRLLASQKSKIDLSSWLDDQDDVNSLLDQLSASTPAVTVSDSEGAGGSSSNGGSPDVDVGGPECNEAMVPETPEGSESASDSDSDSDGDSSSSESDSCASDASSVLTDTSMDYSCDEVFWPNPDKSVKGSDGAAGPSAAAVAAATCEVGDPAIYSDISDAEDEDRTSGAGSARKSPVSGACDYSDISSDEDEREYLSPSSVSPARPRFDYPDTDGHIGNWLPTVYGAPWVHDDPNDCAATDVNCPPAPEGTRAQSVCMLANRPNYFGCVIKNFAADPAFGADSDSEDDGEDDGEDGEDYDAACNVSVDSGLYSCDELDGSSQADYDGDSECDDGADCSPATTSVVKTVAYDVIDADADDDDDVVVVELISDEEDASEDEMEEGGNVMMELAGCDGFVKRYVLHDSPVSVAPGFQENPKLVCASLDVISVAEEKLERLRENDDGLRHYINADRDRDAIEKPGAEGDTHLLLTGPMQLDYKTTIQLGSSHHEFLNTQLILRQYAEKSVPAWFDSMRVTLSASAGERFSISAPQSEWRDFYGYFGDFLEEPLKDLVCVGAPAPKNFARVFERVKDAKFIFLYTSSDNVGGDDSNLIKFLKCLSGGFMSVNENTELSFLTHKPVVVVFREKDVTYPKCTPIIQFVCHDVLPLPYDGDGSEGKGRGHMCDCKVCSANYTCTQEDKPTCRVSPLRLKRKRDDDEDDEALQEALLASVHPYLRAPSTFGFLSDEDSDNVVIREGDDGSFTYEDGSSNVPACRRRRVDAAPRRRRGRPIRLTRRAGNVVAANTVSTESAPTATDNVSDNVRSSDNAPISGTFNNNDLPDIDESPVVRKVTAPRKVPAVRDAPVADQVPTVRARTLRLTTKRVLGPRK